MGLLGHEMARVKARVDKLILENLLPKDSSVPEIALLYRMMRDYPERPAKGLRPFICVTSCRAFGGREDDALIVAASIELFQNWILIHDDIEDGSMMRRGSPALHRKYDWSLALNTGDALHAKMWETLLRCKEGFGDEKTLRIMEEFSRMVNQTTEGQHVELGWLIDKNWDLTESDYYTMCTKKTAWYTTISPLRLGGIITGASGGDLESLIEIGTKLGIGFQIQDDILNLSGDERYGKEIAGDLIEGKRTLILIRLLTTCNEKERRRLIDIMNMGREDRVKEIRSVLDLIDKYGALKYASGKGRELVDDARSSLKGLGWGNDRSAVEMLDAVARFAVERQW